MSKPNNPSEARVVSEGYSVQHIDRRGIIRYLTAAMEWTRYDHLKGVWHDIADAELALARAKLRV